MVFPFIAAALAGGGAAAAGSGAVAAATIGAGATLAGSAIGARQQKKAFEKSSYDNSPQGIRANAEAAGFNPLVFAGPGTGTGAQYAPQMGSIIADGIASAGSLISGAYAQQEQLKIQRTELELERQRLEEIVKASTLTPKVPGIYGHATTEQRRTLGRTALLDNSSVSGVAGGGNGRGLHNGDKRADRNIIFGKRVDESGFFSDAEAIEERYGDVGSSIYGAFVAAADIGSTVGNWLDARRLDRASAEWYRRTKQRNPKPSRTYKPGENKAPRAYYGRPGSVTGF